MQQKFKKNLKARVALRVGVLALMSSAIVVPPPALPEYEVSAKKSKKVKKFKDDCKVYRTPITKIKNQVAKKSIIGVIAGGVLGLIIGSLIQKDPEVVIDKNGNRKIKRGNYALEGLAIGAGAGALAGYASGLEKKKQDRVKLREAVQENRENRENFSPLAQNIADLANCRNRQMDLIANQVEAEELTVDEGYEMMAKVEKWLEKDNKTIAKVLKEDVESVLAFAQTDAIVEKNQSAAQVEEAGLTLLDDYEQEAAKFEPAVEVVYQEGESFTSDEFLLAANEENPTAEVSLAPSEEPEPLVAEEEGPQFYEAFVKSRPRANLRQYPTTRSEVLAKLPFKTSVEVRESDVTSWYEVRYKGVEGFMASSTISDVRPADPAPPPTTTIAKRKKIPAQGVPQIRVSNLPQDRSGTGAQMAVSRANRQTAEASVSSTNLQKARTYNRLDVMGRGLRSRGATQ